MKQIFYVLIFKIRKLVKPIFEKIKTASSKVWFFLKTKKFLTAVPASDLLILLAMI